MIKKIKEVICDYCRQGIDYFDENYTDKEIKRKVTKGGAIVNGSLIFCCRDCKEIYEREKNKKNIGNKI